VTEYRLFEGDVPYVSTPEFHADRERAPHLEQEFHVPRLRQAAAFVRDFGRSHREAAAWRMTDFVPLTVSDLGCGDGGLLSLLKGSPDLGQCWGYDFAPANAAGWTERGVQAYARDVFGADWSETALGDVVVMTEVLEHLADPHGVLRRLLLRGVKQLVCSSPWNESPASHSPEHAWAWDAQGYRDMLNGAGWQLTEQAEVGLFQVVQAIGPAVAV
jgi:trans-aconitate methyltransferase